MRDRSALLARHACAFTWLWKDPDSPQGLSEVRLEGPRTDRNAPLPNRWVIVLNGTWILNRAGTWVDEPSPSARTDDFLAQTRWDSPEEALAFMETHLPGWDRDSLADREANVSV